MTEAEQKELANKAADFTTCTMEYVGYLRTVIRSIEELSSKGGKMTVIKELSGLGSYLADDFHNIVDCEREEFEEIRTSVWSRS